MIHIPLVATRVLLLQMVACGVENWAGPAQVMDLDRLRLIEQWPTLTKWNFGSSHREITSLHSSKPEKEC